GKDGNVEEVSEIRPGVEFVTLNEEGLERKDVDRRSIVLIKG
ncbi:8003_t:CDS:2, partial [Ambispora leptoticha]